MGRPPRTLEKVAEELLLKGTMVNGCLVCHLACDTGGYAQTYYGSAHRVVWIGLFGPTSSWVLHTCNFRSCIHPDHLFLGTCQDNVDDMIAKGRKVISIQHRYINEEQRLLMKKLREEGHTQKELAEQFGVSRSTVARNLQDEYTSNI